jgi:hypothetical protein
VHITPATSTTITPALEIPLGSLEELRTRHSAMLQRREAGDRDIKPTLGEILGFLKAAAALGTALKDHGSREIAQGIMDFWTANLLSQAPNITESFSSFFLEDYNESLAKETIRTAADAAFATLAEETISTADAALAKLPEAIANGDKIIGSTGRREKEALRRLLMRMVRLKEGSLDAYTVPLL